MEKKIIRIGQASVEGSQAGVVVNRQGCCMTICACTHGYAIGYVLRKYEHSRNNWQYGQTEQRSWTSDRGGYKSGNMQQRLERPYKGIETVWKKESLSWAA